LLLVGDGILRPEIEASIAGEGLSQCVRLAGALDRGTIAAVLRAASLFVLSSAYEGMPIAVLEALAVGVPVVGTRVGELPRVIRNGVNGYLSDTRTAADLAAAMQVALREIATLRGPACEASVAPYHATTVLKRIYAQHRGQSLALSQ
jgi:glycosyltransferase involved in cell wall biosynthesis